MFIKNLIPALDFSPTRTRRFSYPAKRSGWGIFDDEAGMMYTSCNTPLVRQNSPATDGRAVFLGGLKPARSRVRRAAALGGDTSTPLSQG
jgi:hypothetical protein